MARMQITAEPAVPQLVVASEFAAPRDLLFRAYTDPELLVRWLEPHGLTGSDTQAPSPGYLHAVAIVASAVLRILLIHST